MSSAVSSMPEALQPYFDKAMQAYAQGWYEYAIDLLSFVVGKAPEATDARRYLRLAIQRHHASSPPSWLARIAARIIIWPLQLWALGLAFQGRHRQAVALYERLLGLDPRARALLFGLAGSLHRSALEDAAVATYEELLTLHPNYVPALRQLAKLSMKRGQDAQARQCLERILTLTPNDLDAQQTLRNLDALGTIKKGFSV